MIWVLSQASQIHGSINKKELKMTATSKKQPKVMVAFTRKTNWFERFWIVCVGNFIYPPTKKGERIKKTNKRKTTIFEIVQLYISIHETNWTFTLYILFNIRRWMSKIQTSTFKNTFTNTFTHPVPNTFYAPPATGRWVAAAPARLRKGVREVFRKGVRKGVNKSN